jgi:hypothetical protein
MKDSHLKGGKSFTAERHKHEEEEKQWLGSQLPAINWQSF